MHVTYSHPAISKKRNTLEKIRPYLLQKWH